MRQTLLEKLISLNYQSDLAKRLIWSGKVLVNDEPILLPHKVINDTDNVRVLASKTYVSRGAYKLRAALESFDLKLTNQVVLDIGASTGGFTEVALEQGASLVYALDVGTNQLDYKLRVHPQVKVLENTNLKTITNSMFDNQIRVVVCDVSFIALYHVFQVLDKLAINDLELITLIKPQYEARRDQVGPKGLVSQTLHQAILEKVIDQAASFNFKLNQLITSPIKGLSSQNVEYLAWFSRRII